MTKYALLAAVPVVAFLLVSVPITKADGYSGPMCFENPAKFTGSGDDSAFFSKEARAVRGTCKQVQFERVISLDKSIASYYFLSGEGAATTTGPITVDGSKMGDYAIRFEEVDDMSPDMVFGHMIYLSDMASDDLFSTMSIASSGVSFVDQYNQPTSQPYTRTYKSDGGVFVPVTSPVTKLIEYWHIASKPNGFELVKDKTDIVLDDGSIKTVVNGHTSASTSAQIASSSPVAAHSWWSGIVQFFQNLF